MTDIDYAPDMIERGRLLFARPFLFTKGCVRIADLPPMDRVEIAFAGRSNVGKSSLINALCGTSSLARTSNTRTNRGVCSVAKLYGSGHIWHTSKSKSRVATSPKSLRYSKVRMGIPRSGLRKSWTRWSPSSARNSV